MQQLPLPGRWVDEGSPKTTEPSRGNGNFDVCATNCGITGGTGMRVGHGGGSGFVVLIVFLVGSLSCCYCCRRCSCPYHCRFIIVGRRPCASHVR
jgi:hypothetical protein